MNTSAPEPHTFSLSELCLLTELSARTVRYYVQIGLVDRPEGETRAARYGTRQLEQLLLIRKWSQAGLSLERIRSLLQGESPPVAAAPTVAGAVVVRSHVQVAQGIEVVVDPAQAGIRPEQLRQLIRGIMAVYAQITAAQTATEIEIQPSENS